jgi:hypothetical protein
LLHANQEADMERAQLDRYLEPPPRLVPCAEPLPHLGGLVLAPYRGTVHDEIESFAVDRLEDAFDAQQAETLLKRTLAHEKVRERLGRSRWVPIGVSRRGETAKGEARQFLVVAYDYGSDTAVEVTLNAEGGLVSIEDQRYQPPLTTAEIARAVELARLDERLAGRLGKLTPMAIPASPEPEDTVRNRRLVEVLFGCPTERLPRFRALVDLSAERVERAGDRCDCCSHEETHS